MAFTTIIHQDKNQLRREAWELVSSNPSDCGDNLPPPAYQDKAKFDQTIDTATFTLLPKAKSEPTAYVIHEGKQWLTAETV